jgi:hypothetical protein
VVPPKRTPDLARMGLQKADFPGSRVGRQGYVKADDPFVASYEREFAVLSVHLGPKRLLGLESDVDVARSVADARLFMAAIPLGIALLDPKDLASAATTGGFRPTYVRLGKPVRVRAGDQALEVTIRMGTKVGEIRVLLEFIRVDRVIDALIVAGVPRGALGIAEATRVGQLAAKHNREGLAPVNTSAPVVTGTPQIGQTLVASPGTWTNKPTIFAYSWQRCDASAENCSATGVSGREYPVAAADAGSTLRVALTATNSIGTGHAHSPPTAPVVGAPTNTAPPTISGTPTVGQTLSGSTGTWAGNPTSFAYQWQRCDAAGATCADIAGASTSTYAVAAADAGSTLRLVVTATNSAGNATAVSAPTVVVT